MKRTTYFWGILAVLSILTGCGTGIINDKSDLNLVDSMGTNMIETNKDILDNVTTESEETPVATPEPEPTPTATPEPEPTPTATPEPEPTPTATPKPEPTPVATPESEPMATPEPNPTAIETSAAEVSYIRITDGNNGKQIDVTEAEKINEILEKVNQLEILGEEKESRIGFLYSLRYFDSQDNSIEYIILHDSYMMMNNKNYIVNSTEDIVTYLAALYKN